MTWLSLCCIILAWCQCTAGNRQNSENFIIAAVDRYAALMNRVDRIISSRTDSSSKAIPIADDGSSDNLIQQMEALKQHRGGGPLNDHADEYIPFIDDIFGFSQPQRRRQQQQQQQQQRVNPHHDYIRRRLQETSLQNDADDDALECKNGNTQSVFPSNYEFRFNPLPDCIVNHSSTVNHTMAMPISSSGAPIVFSPNCQFMLTLNAKIGALQIIASQQSLPVWQSAITDDATSTATYSVQFDADTGDLQLSVARTSDEIVIWKASNSSHWNTEIEDDADEDKEAEEAFVGPFTLQLSDDLGSLYVYDAAQNVRWYSSKPSDALNYRHTAYAVSLVDDDGKNEVVLFSMILNVYFVIQQHDSRRLYLYIQYDDNGSVNYTNMSEAQQSYMTAMLDADYAFNVSVFPLSSHALGDEYVVYDAMNQPMVYTLRHQESAHKLAITESHTFLCIDNQTKYFNVQVVPFTGASTMSLSPMISVDGRNYTLRMNKINYENAASVIEVANDQNYTIALDPWNPCHGGRPVLAEKNNRECFTKPDLTAAIDAYNAYASNAAYANVNMKYVFRSPECPPQVMSRNSSLFPATAMNDSIECQTYGSTDFNASSCSLLRSECDGEYQICVDYTQRLCTCFCPRDRRGDQCETLRDYDCELHILNANMTQCALMTQDELNAHGRSDYDVRLDGDKPCFFVDDDDEQGQIESVVQLQCYFTDSHARSQSWETLVDFNVSDSVQDIAFDYCLGNESSIFALSGPPPQSTLRIKLFNFNRVFSEQEVYTIPLDIEHWSGHKYVYHNRSMRALDSAYKIGGRVYVEYQLWQMSEADPDQQLNRINVERRFYDIDHWQAPYMEVSKLNKSQTWFLTVTVVLVIAMLACCIYKCNRWCKTLEHEKTD